MAGGTLSETIQSRGFKDVPVMRKLQLALQIASGLDYLHTREEPVVHSDIKRYGWAEGPDDQASVMLGTSGCFPNDMLWQHQCGAVMPINT